MPRLHYRDVLLSRFWRRGVASSLCNDSARTAAIANVEKSVSHDLLLAAHQARRSLLSHAVRVIPTALIMIFVIWFYSIDKPSSKVQLRARQDPAQVRDHDERAAAARQYYTGSGAPLNFAKAREHYVEIAKQEPHDGYSRTEHVIMARRSLGEMYGWGLGVPVNWSRAIDYYEQAARLGDSESMLFLGEAYESGSVVQKDLVAAYSWYSKAAATLEYPGLFEVRKTVAAVRQRFELAEKRRQIARELTSEDLRRALAM